MAWGSLSGFQRSMRLAEVLGGGRDLHLWGTYGPKCMGFGCILKNPDLGRKIRVPCYEADTLLSLAHGL
ncbi:hypothetical protein VNO77_03570 [Canavalia gladiata]|uniref:Uncharacterized protein n=1 Tax=Canavalia gladiata TaxID=3824 RepID=A0AAN9R6Y6_CANGL